MTFIHILDHTLQPILTGSPSESVAGSVSVRDSARCQRMANPFFVVLSIADFFCPSILIMHVLKVEWK